jgi:rod shape-determining protein MreD
VLFCLELVIPQPWRAAPDLLLLLVVFYSFREDTMSYVWIAFFGGLLMDAYSRSAFGTYMLSFLIVAMLIRASISTLFRSETSSIIYMAVVITIADLLTVAIIYAYSSIAVHWDKSAVTISPIYINLKVWLDLILNMLLAAPIYLIVESMENYMNKHFRHSSNLI